MDLYYNHTGVTETPKLPIVICFLNAFTLLLSTTCKSKRLYFDTLVGAKSLAQGLNTEMTKVGVEPTVL